ncbi:4-alpha-N-acetylgalactosaminyltransferase [compost metagenome]
MGKGALRPKIEMMIDDMGLANKVTIIDFQKNPYPYIKAAQALILTSDAEGLPTVLIEALICHTPVISVNCPSGPAEILIGELKEFLCPLNDIKTLATSLITQNESPTKIDKSYYQVFSSEETINKFMQL